MSAERARLEHLRRWKLVASWAPVVWFPIVVFALSVEKPLVATTLALAGAAFAGAARIVVWTSRCPRCSEPFRARHGGFRRIWDEAGCLACGLSLFELRRAGADPS